MDGKKHKIVFIVIFIIIIIISIAFAYRILQENNPSQQSKIATPVTAMLIKTQPIDDTINALGTAVAFESVTITADVTEIVRSIHFNDGDYVKKGQLLIQLSTSEEQAQLASATAIVNNAQKNFDRTLNLSGKNYIAQSQHDQAKADLETAQAKAKEIQANINNRIIRAPFNGYLGLRQVSPGALVQPGTAIVTIDKTDPMKVDFTLPEKYLSQIKIEQAVEATSIAYPDRKFNGKIVAVNSRIDTATRSFTVRANFDNKNQLLKPGMLLKISILIQSIQAILIPEHAVILKNGKKYVFVINSKNNSVDQKTVKLGQRESGHVVVTQGLKKGDTIVVDGAFKLTNHQHVSIINHSNESR